MLSYANFKLTPLIKWQNRTHPKSRILWRFSNLFYSVVVQKVKTCPKITFNVMILMFMFLKGSPNIMTVAGRARDWFYAQCLKIVQKVAFNFASGQTVLPDRSILIGQKIGEECQNWKIQMRLYGWFLNTVLCWQKCSTKPAPQLFNSVGKKRCFSKHEFFRRKWNRQVILGNLVPSGPGFFFGWNILFSYRINVKFVIDFLYLQV